MERDYKHVPANKDIKMSQGSYGCVFHPALKCSDLKSINSKLNGRNVQTSHGDVINSKYADNKNYVTKFLSIDEVVQELKISCILHIVDPKGQYTSTYKPETCKTIEIDKKYIDKCDPYQNDNITNFIGVYMDYGGISFRDWLKEFNFNTKESLDILVKLFINASEGLLLMHMVNVAHMDIKPDNLLIDYHSEKESTLKYIDFGLSIYDGSKIHDIGSTYVYWPPDYLLLDSDEYKKYMTSPTHKQKAKRFNKIDADHFWNNVQSDAGINENPDLYCFGMWPEFENKPEMLYKLAFNFYKKTPNKYLKTIDIYSLGYTFMSIFVQCEHVWDNKLHDVIMSILKKMMNPDCTKRLTDKELAMSLIDLRKMVK